MKENNPLMQPLSEDEIDWLIGYLDEMSETYEDTMSLEEIDGLFCALIVNPILADPFEWLNVVFDENFEFESKQEAEKIINLLMRHWNHINNLLRYPPKNKKGDIKRDDIYIPLLIEHDEDNSTYKLAQQWATGFSIGMNYCLDKWDELLKDEEHYGLIVPILLLELGYNPDKEDVVITNEERENLFVMLPSVAYSLFEYWQEKAKKIKEENKERKIKIGRNDPCHCGSGKKYKKCCMGSFVA